MSQKKEVVLDRAGVVRLWVGVVVLVAIGFTTGAVVGFGLHPEAAALVEARPAVPASRTATRVASAEPCVPADSGRAVGMAAAKTPDSTRTGAPEHVDSADARVDPPSRPRTVVAEAPTHRPASGPRYAVQVGVFGVPANAKRLAARLRSRGYDPLVTAMRNRSGHWLRRVDLSVFADQDEAQDSAASFRVREGLPAVVVAYLGSER